MKLLFVIPRMSGGGAERVIANLSNAMSLKNKVRIVTIVSKDSFYKINENVDIQSANLKINRSSIFTTYGCYIKYFFKSLKFIKKNIEEMKPDCIISFLPETDILTYLASKKNKKVAKIFSERNDPSQRSKFLQKILNTIYKKADLFVCQSAKVYQYYSKIDNNKKIIIPNPINCEVLPEPSIDEGSKNVVSAGRFFEQKNFSLLIRSFEKAINFLPKETNLIIYGDGPLRNQYEDLIKKLDLQNRVLLPGSKKDVFNEISNGAVFVLSSNYEGFPNVLLESMAIGLPVISTNFYTGVAEELIKTENGIIVPVNDDNKMSEAIISLMKDYEKRIKMRKENVKVRDYYSIDIIMKKWCGEIKKTIERKNNE